MANPTPINLTEAKFQDLAVSGINTRLAERLTWLTTYGVAVKKPNETGFFPAIETQSNDTTFYLPMFPDSKIGTFSWWDVADGIGLEKKGDFIIQRFEAGLVIWGDLRDVYGNPGYKSRNVQNALYDVTDALKRENFGTSSVKILKSFMESRNIYKGYQSKEAIDQHLMRPFFGFRIDCHIVHKQFCP